MGLTQIVNSLAMILVMIAPGFILGKLKIFQKVFYDGLSHFAISLCIPALIIQSLQVDYTPEILMGLGKTFIFWVVMMAFAFGYSVALVKIFKLGKKQLTLAFCMLAIPNTGFVGIPLCLQLYGQESLFFASATEIVGDFFMYSVIITSISAASGKLAKISFRTLFVNPPMIALFIGIVLFFTRVALPSFIATPINYFSTATAPIALFVLGSQLSNLTAKDFVSDKRAYMVCFMKLILMPLVAFLIIRVLLKDTSLFSVIFIMMQGMPAAGVTGMLAQSYNSDVEFATKSVLLSTSLCILTLPVLAMVL